MKGFFSILVLVCLAWSHSLGQAANSSPATTSPQAAGTAAIKPVVNQVAEQNATQAKKILEDAIKALGGETYLTIRDREQQGRGYGFHGGRPTGSGGVFWSFTEFPDKERVELTKERDIAELYVGNKG